MKRNNLNLVTRSISAVFILFTGALAVSCAQNETQKLIAEMNANRTKCQELTKQAETKRAEAKRQNDNGQIPERKKSIEEAASLYGQIAKLLNESADKGDKIVSITTTDWYKEYFTLYSKWTRNLGTLAAGVQDELLVKNYGRPTDDQVKVWQTMIADMKKENDALAKQIAKLESEHHMVPVVHD
jgi:cell division protein FtsB